MKTVEKFNHKTMEQVIISKERFLELLKIENYVNCWCQDYIITCDKCGSLHPGGCICAQCDYDNSEPVDEKIDLDWFECEDYEDVGPDYLEMFKSLPNLNFDKQPTTEDFYNPTLYPWDGGWIVSWVSDEGDSLIEFVGKTPEEAIESALNEIKQLTNEK